MRVASREGGYLTIMQDPRPSTWRHRDRRRRTTVRGLLLAGAVVGLLGGLLAQVLVDEGVSGSDIEWLVRAALVLPAVIFVSWWLLAPGIALDEPSDTGIPVTIDPAERLGRIEATFDTAAVPCTRRRSLDSGDAVVASDYRASLRRDASDATVDRASFGVARPTPVGEDTGT